jgi:hypothetical protein
MRKGLLAMAFLLLVGSAWAQSPDSLRTLFLQEVEVQSTRKVVFAANQGLYEMANPDNDYEQIAGFSSLVILDGAAGEELWSDSKKGCMRIKLNGDTTYTIGWDKPGGGCSWVGMGVGWDMWSGKNLAPLLDSAAIEIKVKLPAGRPVKTLPLAFGLEDYSNRQAWMGMSARWVIDGPIGNQYAHIRLPLQEFNWAEQNTDASNIKQLIIQFEAAGEVILRHIRLVRHAGTSRKQAAAATAGNFTQIPWQAVGSDSMRLRWDNQHLYVEALLADAEMPQNGQTGANLWNGDALEVALAAQPELSSRPRGRFLFSDIHLGIGLGEKAEAIDFRTQQSVPVQREITALPQGGYRVTATIRWSDLAREPWRLAGRYLLEMARDQGDARARREQLRWNSTDQEGFHQSPALWGELLFKP